MWPFRYRLRRRATSFTPHLLAPSEGLRQPCAPLLWRLRPTRRGVIARENFNIADLLSKTGEIRWPPCVKLGSCLAESLHWPKRNARLTCQSLGSSDMLEAKPDHGHFSLPAFANRPSWTTKPVAFPARSSIHPMRHSEWSLRPETAKVEIQVHSGAITLRVRDVPSDRNKWQFSAATQIDSAVPSRSATWEWLETVTSTSSPFSTGI